MFVVSLISYSWCDMKCVLISKTSGRMGVCLFLLLFTLEKHSQYVVSTSYCESIPDRSQLSLYLHIKKLHKLLSLLLFIFVLYNNEKHLCRCSLGFYVKSYLTDTRKCQPNPKVKKQLDYPFL